MITPNGGVFGRNPKFNNVTVDGNLTVNGDIALGDDITVTDTLTVGGATTITDATAAISTTTGALKVTGGISTQNAIHAASDSFINGLRIGRGANNTATVLGASAGLSLGASSDRNTLIGQDAGRNVSSAARVTAVGYAAVRAASTAGDQTGVGDLALYQASGAGNIGIGFAAGAGFQNAYSSGYNTFIGTECGYNVAGGLYAVGIGSFAMYTNAADDNVAIGTTALANSGVARFNVACGRSSLNAATTSVASLSTVNAGTGGSDGTKTSIQLERVSGAFMSTYPTVDITVTSGAVSGAIAVVTGGTGLRTSTAGGIVLKANAAGIAAGVPANWTCQLSSVSRGESNSAFGHNSGLLVSLGSQNSAFGSTALDALVSGSRNSAFGFDSLGAATGSDNTALGSDSGDGISTGSQNTCIGSNADTAASGDSNSTVIGYNAVGDGSNTVVIGNSSVTSHKLHGTATSAAIISGDTLRIVTRKAPASNAAGTAGDICVGTDGGVTYLYFCIANNNWGRVAFTTGY